MCNARNDIIEVDDTFWAIDKHTDKIANRTGHCLCVYTEQWAVYAIDGLGNERIFHRHKFRFEQIIKNKKKR